MAKSILVIGGAGYIGSHICKTLAEAGYLPVTLDNLSSGYNEFVKFGPFVKADIDDADVVGKTIRQYEIEVVIDLAGSIEVGESVRDPLKYYQNNVASKIQFLRVANENGVRAIVLSSTAAVYGEPQSIPIKETHPLNPKNPYGWSKLMYEQILRDNHLAGGPAWMALRYFNAAGASPDLDIGECHEPETHLIPRACLAQLGKVPALDIYGNDYPTPDGTALRDYVHVLDLASAHLLAVKALLEGAKPAAYNLGNGKGTSIGEVLKCFAHMGIPVPHNFKPRREGDPTQLIADSSAIRRDLGWAPKHSEIKDIINSAYNWHRAYTKTRL